LITIWSRTFKSACVIIRKFESLSAYLAVGRVRTQKAVRQGTDWGAVVGRYGKIANITRITCNIAGTHPTVRNEAIIDTSPVISKHEGQ
jgi:hypothetical protein